MCIVTIVMIGSTNCSSHLRIEPLGEDLIRTAVTVVPHVSIIVLTPHITFIILQTIVLIKVLFEH